MLACSRRVHNFQKGQVAGIGFRAWAEGGRGQGAGGRGVGGCVGAEVLRAVTLFLLVLFPSTL
jgi:hypothetical protein